jgi:hypothetical protein
VSLDAKIDELYREPLDGFTAARNALAKTLKGDEAKRVRALAKPTVVPWAVNQVYWHARPTYDRVIKSGERLRAAQIASLEGRRGGDVREAGDAHRRALADAVKEAERLAALTGSSPAADALMRTFEALSLATAPVEPPGRLTKALQPAGFEALAGVVPAPVAREGSRRGPAEADRKGSGKAVAAAPPARDLKKERAEAEAARRRADAIKEAEAVLARAEKAESRARETWERAHDELVEARQKLSQVRSSKSEA